MTEYATPLRLVSPPMKGVAVRDAQWLMKGNSRFGKELAPYKDGKIDKVYGPVTAGATRRAKYWLGYPTGQTDETFGQTLYEYLRPQKWRRLPWTYRLRRKLRLRKAAQTPGLKAYREAEKHLGYHETGKNRTMFGEWFGWNGVAWCAIFVSYCLAHSGWNRFKKAWVGDIYLDASAGRNGLRIVYTPQTGDIVGFFRTNHYAHTAFFGRKLSSTTFEDLGGNTMGGQVAKQVRNFSDVHFFARVG
jgi:hypothetical protein